MKSLLRTLVLILVATTVAQTGVANAQSSPAQKRVVKIDDSTGELVDVTPAQQEVVQAPASAAPGIVILNNQRSNQASNQQSSQSAIQDQPTNVIEESPLSMSSAERRRRDRQNLEMQTEQKIVEKLEEARIEDERSRTERLFNKGFSSGREHVEAHQPAPQAVQVIQVPVAQEAPRVNVREEVRAALDDLKPKETTGNQYYVNALVGVGEYSDAQNVRGDMAVGVGLGMMTPDRFVVEGTFQYSQFKVDQPGGYSSYQTGYSSNYATNYGGYGNVIPFTKVSQYNMQTAVKYQLLNGRLRPLVGAIAGYTYRSYQGQNSSLYTTPGYYGSNVGDSASTHAFDLGALIGLDVQITNSFTVGGEFRYMKNVAYRGNNDYSNAYSYAAPFKRLEEINYYLGSVVGRFSF